MIKDIDTITSLAVEVRIRTHNGQWRVAAHSLLVGDKLKRCAGPFDGEMLSELLEQLRSSVLSWEAKGVAGPTR